MQWLNQERTESVVQFKSNDFSTNPKFIETHTRFSLDADPFFLLFAILQSW